MYDSPPTDLENCLSFDFSGLYLNRHCTKMLASLHLLMLFPYYQYIYIYIYMSEALSLGVNAFDFLMASFSVARCIVHQPRHVRVLTWLDTLHVE